MRQPTALSAQEIANASKATDARVAELGSLLLAGGLGELSQRERRVIASIARRHHVTRSVNQAVEERQTFGERLADRVARFGGSWTFILIFCAFLAAWAALNTVYLSRSGDTFDPYPFIFLNLLLSMVAALQAPVILMSQNRQAARDRVAAALDYEVNLKAELEIMALGDRMEAARIEQLHSLLEQQSEDLQRLLAQRLG